MPIIVSGSTSARLIASLAEEYAPPQSDAPRPDLSAPRKLSAMRATAAGPAKGAANDGRDSLASPTLADLQYIADGALAIAHCLWRDSGVIQFFPRILVTATRIADLARGLYVVDNAGLTPIPGDSSVPATPGEAGTACAALHICGDLGSAIGHLGPAGYVQLLVRAGALAQAMARQASALGLDAAIRDVGCSTVTAASRRIEDGLTHLASVTIGVRTP